MPVWPNCAEESDRKVDRHGKKGLRAFTLTQSPSPASVGVGVLFHSIQPYVSLGHSIFMGRTLLQTLSLSHLELRRSSPWTAAIGCYRAAVFRPQELRSPGSKVQGPLNLELPLHDIGQGPPLSGNILAVFNVKVKRNREIFGVFLIKQS